MRLKIHMNNYLLAVQLENNSFQPIRGKEFRGKEFADD